MRLPAVLILGACFCSHCSYVSRGGMIHRGNVSEVLESHVKLTAPHARKMFALHCPTFEPNRQVHLQDFLGASLCSITSNSRFPR